MKIIIIILAVITTFISIKYIDKVNEVKYLEYKLYLTSEEYLDHLKSGGYELDYEEYQYYISKKEGL